MGFFLNLKIKKLRRQLDENPGDVSVYRDLIQALTEDQNFEEARAVVQKAMERSWPQEQLAWFTSRKVLLTPESGDPFVLLAESIELCSRGGMDPEQKIVALSNVIDRCLEPAVIPPDRVKDMMEAASMLQNLVSSTSDRLKNWNIRNLLSRVHERMGNDVEAYRLAASLIPEINELRIKKSGQVYYRAAGLAMQSGGQTSRALEHFQSAVESGDLSDHEVVESLLLMGRICFDHDQPLDAMAHLENAVRFSGSRKDRQTATVRSFLAQVYFILGRVPQARKEVALALPDLEGDEITDALLWAASMESQTGNSEAALKYAVDACRQAVSPDRKINSLLSAADLSVAAGAMDQAVKYLNRIITDLESDLDDGARFRLARLFTKTDQAHRSLKILQSFEHKSLPPGITSGHVLFEEAQAFRKQLKIVRAIEKLLQFFRTVDESDPVFATVKEFSAGLKKELSSAESVKRYKLDGADRKSLANLVTQLPSEDDFLTRLRKGLARTKAGLIGGIEAILSGKTQIDQGVLDELEELLILSDIGVGTTRRIIDGLSERMKKKDLKDIGYVKDHIRQEIQAILQGSAGMIEPQIETRPHVIMVVGVNGVGKTTTIAKIAKRFKDQGKNVLLAAGDTFRAGAIEQLQEWGRRIETEVIAQTEGSDPSAVAWDAIAAAKTRQADIVILDTAGRLHTKSNLMEELKKVHRVVGKNVPGAPHEILLVLDATTGQNAIIQAKLFQEAVNVSGIALTKLDGTAKGGIIIAIAESLKIPVKLIGIGEGMDDLRDFDAVTFADALFEE